jgi:hypothetical protein
LKFASPPYTAATVAAPIASVETAALVALPPLNAIALPKSTPLIWNCTVPVGVPAPGGTAATVAVNVTDWPNTEGFADELTTAELSELFIVAVVVPAADVHPSTVTITM